MQYDYRSGEPVCEICLDSLVNGEYIHKWEMNNMYPYIICPNCGHKNYEDDDDD